MIFSKSASKISIILRHQVKVVKSAENEEILSKNWFFVKIIKFSKFHGILLNLAKFRPRAKGLLGVREFHSFWEVFWWKCWNFMKFHEFHEISRISWFYEKMLNSWNSAFSSRSGSQNASFLLAKQSYSACWAMQMTISCNFMENYDFLWFFIKLKKNENVDFAKFP